MLLFISGDKGVEKVIIKEGSGNQIPESGVRAIVHYIGRLQDGTQFDSSRKRNSPLTFNLNKREVILGWDKGISTMKKGEISTLYCKPEYAYGNRDMGIIPPNSTLEFEVELLDWLEVKNSLFTMDGVFNIISFLLTVLVAIYIAVYYSKLYLS